MIIQRSLRATLTASVAFILSVLVVHPACAQAAPATPETRSATDSARVEWLRKHAAPIRTVDPADEDFSDLHAIGRAIGDARVVFLGEPDHGTGNLFSAQARLAKYLHQHHGFDVLVYEAGLYDGSRVWDAILAGEDAQQAFRLGIPPVWSGAEEVRPLMEYVAAHARSGRPLEVAGYDAQFTGRASFRDLVPELRAWLDSARIGEQFADDSVLWSGFRRIHHLSSPRSGPPENPWNRPDSAEVAPFLARLHLLRGAISAGVDVERARFWSQVLESVDAFARQVALMTADPEAKNWYVWFNLRDEQGGRNLVWLANDRYRDRKLIVWLATFHAGRNLQQIEDDDISAHVIPTGHHVWQALGRQMYMLGMVALEGESDRGGTTRPIVADQRPEFELEEMLGEAGFTSAFLDFRSIPAGGEWLRGPLVSRPFANRAMLAPSWPDVLDGLLFVRTGTPGTWQSP
jgi:erythromycin esterase